MWNDSIWNEVLIRSDDEVGMKKWVSTARTLISIAKKIRVLCHSLFKEGFSWERHTTASSLYLPLYTGYAWSIFGGRRSLNPEARQTRQVAVSLLSWQFPVLRNHSLSIEHCQKRDWRSRPACGLFGVLIHGYDLTRTLSNLVSRGSFSLLNLQGATHSHWWFMSSIG